MSSEGKDAENCTRKKQIEAWQNEGIIVVVSQHPELFLSGVANPVILLTSK